MTQDVNILIATSRSDHPHYISANALLNVALDSAEAGQPMLILSMVASGFLRFLKPSQFTLLQP